MVPQAINNLQNLEYLSLNHNPLLESLPGSLGHLPNIRSKVYVLLTLDHIVMSFNDLEKKNLSKT